MIVIAIIWDAFDYGHLGLWKGLPSMKGVGGFTIHHHARDM